MIKKESPLKVSVLLNAHLFYLHWTFIIRENKEIRLIAINKRKFTLEKNYKTVRGAKIAFTRIFSNLKKNYKTFKLKQEWSPFYEPEKEWIDWVMKSPDITYPEFKKELGIEEESEKENGDA